MTPKEFQTLFPNADPQKFSEVFGYMVFHDSDNILYDVNEPAFWDNPKFVEYLNLSKEEKKLYDENHEKFLS